MKTVKNIIKVERTYYKNMRGMLRLSNDTVKMPETDWKEISIKSPAELTISDATEDHNLIFTAKLLFLTCESLDRRHYAYRCTTVEGKKYLIGNYERPFVTISVTSHHPSNMTDNQLDEVAATYITTRKIPLIQ